MPKRKTRHKRKVEKEILARAMQDPAFRESVQQATPEEVRRILDEVVWGKVVSSNPNAKPR